MNIDISASAQKRLTNILENQSGQIELYYNENFQGSYACSIRGVFELKISDNISEDCETLDSPLGPIYIDPDKKEHLDEGTLIDYKENMNTLQLKGNSGMIVDNLRVVDDQGKSI
ncbi:iron-sulfur cluster biosynthesis family protein [Marinilactibacillus piezotolerans]|uniref:iron-sulfur cluster biosynthesis family protein n=1 Tax=Marinilactibacillus piezotolerans TaxID=258723 RepID=UPI0009B00226|nr:iron-sulfur cluster biosynthesis family protein [Marinilactibacillus piezotolerans]